jgi:butyryl-CoA dehydrogenase
VAKIHFVTAAVDRKKPFESFSAFVVPGDAKGLSIGRVEEKMGQKACPAAEVVFEDVFVPERDRLGEEGEGMLHTMVILSASRGPVGAIANGIARGAFERAYYYAASTRRKGKYLIEDQRVQYLLAEMLRQIHLSRQAVYDAAFYFDFEHMPKILAEPVSRVATLVFPYRLRRSFSGLPIWDRMYRFMRERAEEKVPLSVRSQAVRLSSIAKVSGSDTAVSVCRMAMEILGEDALNREWGIEKCWRDAKLTQIYEGTNQLNRLAIIKELREPGVSEGIGLK